MLVKHRGNGPAGIVGSRMTYATHPFDVVGWDGCLYPYAFNVADYVLRDKPALLRWLVGWYARHQVANGNPQKLRSTSMPARRISA